MRLVKASKVDCLASARATATNRRPAQIKMLRPHAFGEEKSGFQKLFVRLLAQQAWGLEDVKEHYRTLLSFATWIGLRSACSDKCHVRNQSK